MPSCDRSERTVPVTDEAIPCANGEEGRDTRKMHPKTHPLRIRFWGTRGSLPAPQTTDAKPESGRHTHDIYPAGATLLRPGDLWRKQRLRRNSRRGRFRLMRRGYGSQRFRQRRHESDVERPGRFAQDLSPLYVSSALGSYPGVSVLFPRLFARLSDPDLRVSSGASRRVRMSAKPALLSGPFVGHVRRHLVSHPGRGASL